MWFCPHCKARHMSSDNPDHYSDGRDVFTFECECGSVLQVEVAWEPEFHVKPDFVPPPGSQQQ